MAIRLALGARSWQMAWLTARQGLVLIGGGIGVGLIAAWGLSGLLRSLVFGVGITDATTYAISSVVLAAVALLTTLVPLRRLALIDPAVRLRYQ